MRRRSGLAGRRHGTLDRWCCSQEVADVAGSMMNGTFCVKFSSTMAFCMDRESEGSPSAFHLMGRGHHRRSNHSKRVRTRSPEG